MEEENLITGDTIKLITSFCILKGFVYPTNYFPRFFNMESNFNFHTFEREFITSKNILTEKTLKCYKNGY